MDWASTLILCAHSVRSSMYLLAPCSTSGARLYTHLFKKLQTSQIVVTPFLHIGFDRPPLRIAAVCWSEDPLNHVEEQE